MSFILLLGVFLFMVIVWLVYKGTSAHGSALNSELNQMNSLAFAD